VLLFLTITGLKEVMKLLILVDLPMRRIDSMSTIVLVERDSFCVGIVDLM
jgi:hypothetical protein